MLETFGINEEIRKVLMDAEYYHYLVIQIRVNTLANFLLAIYGLVIFIFSFLSMDYIWMNDHWHTHFSPKSFLSQFALLCAPKIGYWKM